MSVRAVCNIVYAHNLRLIDNRSDKVADDREKFDGELYERDGDMKALRLIDQIGG